MSTSEDDTERGAPAGATRVSITVELGAELERFAVPAVGERIAGYLREMLEDLGLPVDGDPVVHVQVRTGIAARSFELLIDSSPARLPFGEELDVTLPATQVADRIAAALVENRERLVTPAVVERLGAAWIARGGEGAFRDAPAPLLGAVLVELVRRGMRVDRAKDAALPSWSASSPPTAELWFERSVWAIDAYAIRVHVGDAAAHSAPGQAPLGESLARVQKALFDDLGILLPTIEVVPDAALRPAELRVQLNDLRWPPIAGLDFMAHALCAMIRREAASFVCGELLGAELDRVAQASPMLVRIAREQIEEHTLVRVLRELLDEEVSIRDREAILRCLLALDTTAVFATSPSDLVVPAEPGSTVVVWSATEPATLDVHDLAAAVRAGLRPANGRSSSAAPGWSPAPPPRGSW